MLKVVNLQVSYGKVRVLFDVSLSIEEGKIVSLVGANGSGKSTLLNTVSGLIRPVSGKIIFNEIELTVLLPHEIVHNGVVQIPEGRKLFPAMTVYENLMMGGVNPRVRKDRPRMLGEIYKEFPLLKERSKQMAGTLSGGEQQMLAITRGLMAQPKFLMLDEPSLGLAPLMVKEIFRIIKSLNHKGLTVFLVEQNVKQSLSLCDYGYILKNGKIVLQGTGDDLQREEMTRKAYLGL